LIIFLFFFYGLVSGMYRSVGKAYAVDFVPEHLRASAIGWYSTTVGLSTLFASSIAGVIWVNINPAAAFIFGGVFGILGLTALLLF